MVRYVALLRGINVGGKNVIKMKDLATCFEEHGYRNVATYIQSGNVLFDTPAVSVVKLSERVEAMLSSTFAYQASVVLRTAREMQAIVDDAPENFGTLPTRYRYDVVFLKPSLVAAAALASVPTRVGVDEAHAGQGVLYFSRLISKASQSRLSRITAIPIYQSMTIRNWNTTVKLLERMTLS